VPLVELRLRVPFGRAPLARATLLSQALFTGTSTMSSIDIAAELQAVGGGLSAGLDPDRLLVTGNALASGLDRILEILAAVLTDASYPGRGGGHRTGTARRPHPGRAEPARAPGPDGAAEADVRPPSVRRADAGAEQVRGVRPGQLRRLHADRMRPDGAVLVLVGDLHPDKAIDAADKALGSWTGPSRDGNVPPTPALQPGPLLLVDRPGSVQSSLRMALPAVDRTHPDYAALQLANLVFGGYFSSRWVENIREDKGYTYGPHTAIEHFVAGSALVAAAEVATEVTGRRCWRRCTSWAASPASRPARRSSSRPGRTPSARCRLGMSTQAGLAGLASM
jgi:hypothetical protein